MLAGSGATISLQTYDAAGLAADAGTGAGTCAITDGAGAAIAGSPFTPAHTNGTGLYVVTLPTTLTQLDTYKAVWVTTVPAGTTYFEVVGGFLFAQAEVRAFDTALAAKTSAQIVAVREVVEERFEAVTGRAFSSHGRRFTLDGNGSCELMTYQVGLASVVSASIGTTALTAPQLAALVAYGDGRIVRSDGGLWSWGSRNVALLTVHGTLTAPAELHRAGLQYARHLLLTRAMETERATAAFSDLGGWRLTIAGRDGPIGIPDVDAALKPWTAELGLVGFA